MSEWYFMTGGEQQGPVTASQLKGLAAAGTLGPEDLVWNQSMTEWVPARRVKGLPFAGQAAKPAAAKPAAAQPAAAARRAVVETPPPEPEPEESAPPPADAFEPSEPAEEPHRKIESAKTADDAAPSEAAEILGQTRFWVGVMSLLFFVALALGIAYEVWRILPEAKHAAGKVLLAKAQTKWGMRQIVRSLAALLMLIPWFAMVRLGSALGRAKSGGTREDIDNAMKAQKSFWKKMAVTSILVIVIGVSAYLYKTVLQK
jgi:hypothetical protein